MESTFWALAVIGSTVFCVKLLLLFLGADGSDGIGDADLGDLDGGAADLGDADAGEIAKSGSSAEAFTFFSIQTLATFSMGCGWAGLFARGTLGLADAPAEAVSFALFFGAFCAWLIAFLLHKVRGLEQRGNLVPRRAIGATGSVYLTIPESGRGQVQVALQGRLATLDARTEQGSISTGEQVTVEAVDRDGTLVVRRHH